MISQKRDRCDRTRKDVIKTTPLGVEQLEKRLMNAVDSIQLNLQHFISPNATLGSTQLVGKSPVVTGIVSKASNAATVNASATTNQAPTIVAPLTLSTGTVVLNRSVNATILGADDKGEGNLTYYWSVLRAPTNSTINFAVNNSNMAKNNTLSFTRAGDYEVRAMVTDKGNMSTSTSLRFTVRSVATGIQLQTADGRAVPLGTPITTSLTSLSFRMNTLDQFGTVLSSSSNITWSMLSGPQGASIRSGTSGLMSQVTFSRVGTYSMRAMMSGKNVDFTVVIHSKPSAFQVTLPNTNTVAPGAAAIPVTGTTTSVGIRVIDQFQNTLASTPVLSWTTISTSNAGIARVSMSGTNANITFSNSGSYRLRVSFAGISRDIDFSVASTLKSLQITPGVTSMTTLGTQKFSVRGFDQFQRELSTFPTVTWSTSDGNITVSGDFTAPSTAGSVRISASAGSVSSSLAISLVAPTAPNAPTNFAVAGLGDLIRSLYLDNSISRTEMIQILRSVGTDSTVDSTELSDLRALVTSTNFAMPAYVRELARDVVFDNSANMFYQGQSAGNLTGGSSAVLLNKLVDKWFLGADVPTVTSASFTYRDSTGNLFNGTPSRNDAKQGQVGDCYFIASLVSIADENPNAVRNMFIDNFDGTYTVRFFGGNLGSFLQNGMITAGFVSGAGVADYVTVNRKLPTYSNGMLAYSGFGLSATNPATTLWIALAEKAYAQWNETGKTGRSATNSYAAIAGGWMSNSNAHVLGTNSTNYSFANTNKQNMITALNTGRAVTLGTTGTASLKGLVGGHAYTVVSYNPSTDAFTLHNPWGTAQPNALTWTELQQNCSSFCVADPRGSVAISTASVKPVSASATDFGIPPVILVNHRFGSTWNRTESRSTEAWLDDSDLTDTVTCLAASYEVGSSENLGLLSCGETVYAPGLNDGSQDDDGQATVEVDGDIRTGDEMLVDLAMIELYLKRI